MARYKISNIGIESSFSVTLEMTKKQAYHVRRLFDKLEPPPYDPYAPRLEIYKIEDENELQNS